MQNDVEMMQSYVAKYGQVGVTSVLHLKEAIIFLTEKPEIIQQVVFVDILKRHEGKVRPNAKLPFLGLSLEIVHTFLVVDLAPAPRVFPII